MSTAEMGRPRVTSLPDHTMLPESDGAIVENFQEHPQSLLLTDALRPVLDARHPNGWYAIGQDSGIYWMQTDPPLRGCKAPDWFYVPDVPPTLDGQVRRSYVLWQEILSPLIVIEFASGDGSEERDKTPWQGKFWVYERAISAGYYVIYEADPGRIEAYQLVHGRYQSMTPNERGHFPIAELGVELGLWNGRFHHWDLPWLRWYDDQGRLLPTGHERADTERQRADAEQQRAERLAAQLRALGIEPEA